MGGSRMCEEPPDFRRPLLLQLFESRGLQHLAGMLRAAELYDRHIPALAGSGGYQILKDIGIPTAGKILDLRDMFASASEKEGCTPSPSDRPAIARVLSSPAMLKLVFPHLGSKEMRTLTLCNLSWKSALSDFCLERGFVKKFVKVEPSVWVQLCRSLECNRDSERHVQCAVCGHQRSMWEYVPIFFSLRDVVEDRSAGKAEAVFYGRCPAPDRICHGRQLVQYQKIVRLQSNFGHKTCTTQTFSLHVGDLVKILKDYKVLPAEV